LTPSRSLLRLQSSARARLARLSQVAAETSPLSGNAVDRATAYVVIEAANLWAAYCRALFLSSAYGGRDSSGPVLPPGKRLPTEEAAITFAIGSVKPNVLKMRKPPWTAYDEPAWRVPKQFNAAMIALGARNAATVGKALSTSSPVLQEIPTFRHFYAHRSKATVAETGNVALAYSVPATQHPTEVARTYQASLGESLLEAWLRDLDSIVALTV
jgi:hypothetical protein